MNKKERVAEAVKEAIAGELAASTYTQRDGDWMLVDGDIDLADVATAVLKVVWNPLARAPRTPASIAKRVGHPVTEADWDLYFEYQRMKS